MFWIENTLSFNKERLTEGNEYDYVTRTSLNQGILQTTGFVNEENLNEENVWSLGLLQMDFFYRRRKWYAGQFVRKIIPKFATTENNVKFFSVILNKIKPILLQVLVRNVDETFKNQIISLPIKNKQIDFKFMDTFIAELEAERIAELSAYLKVSGLDNYKLSAEELKALQDYENVEVKEFEYQEIFEKIAQGRRLKKSDQIDGNIPFVMSGVTNTGIVNYVSNPVVMFPKNSITLDIFGNAFYRSYDFGAGDDTGVYWNENNIFNKDSMLFITTSMRTSVLGKYDYGKKLRSSQSKHIKMLLPVKNGKPDVDYMKIFTKAIVKLVIKDVVRYADERINATKKVVAKN